MNILIPCIFLGIVIFFHELGHYIFAKLSGCAVSQFSLGFGPRVFGFRKRETDYRFSLLPIIGGYVKLTGMEGEVLAEDEKEIETARKYGLKTYEELSTPRKLSILLGGVLVQCLLCILILSLVVIFVGRPVTKVIVVEPLPDSPASKAGLREGDVVVSIGDQKIYSTQQMIELVAQSTGQSLKFVIKRDGKELIFRIKPEFNPKQERFMIGVQVGDFSEYSKENMRLVDYLTGGLVLTYKMTVLMLQHLWLLIRGQISWEHIVGPVGLVKVTSTIAKTGFLNLITFFALINMNLAIINSLPLPAVDGGHVLILLCEKISRRQIPTTAKNVINYVGFGLIILLMLLITFNDIKKLATGYFEKLGGSIEESVEEKK